MQVPEHFVELSIRMSEVLDEIGAGENNVMERRETFLRRERMRLIGTRLSRSIYECFHFGSQSEGTTIPGLQSDIDFLLSSTISNIMTVWGDWEAGVQNLMMLHDDNNPPQQYLLQVIRHDKHEPMTSLNRYWYVKNDSGQVFLSAELLKQDIEHELKSTVGETTKHGPSVSYIPNWDMVKAFHVLKPLPEIQHWIDQCRGRHWPPIRLLEAARVAPCFLVPAGHPDSDYKRDEWRLSPNLIERMLMFSFNMTQIKCYIILKLINKSLFANIVGDSLTSFHSKTIMFYTIEKTHPSLWVEHNLMFLIWLCLHLLRKWLRLGRLPHYIIKGVNLFDGKLSKVHQRRLLLYVDTMIKNHLQQVFNIGIDQIGYRLQAFSIRRIGKTGEFGGVCLRNSIRLLLTFERLQELLCLLRTSIYKIDDTSYRLLNTFNERDIYDTLCIACQYFTNVKSNVKLKTVALEFIKHLYALQNSIQSSNCLRQRNVVYSKIIRRSRYYLNTDVASSRLKLASILYSSGHIHAAVRVLDDVERRCHSKVKAVCGCRTIEGDSDLWPFANMLSGYRRNGLSEPPFAFCIRLFRQESYCTPFIILFEMHRNITEEEATQRRFVEKQWMDCAEVDARPFLHYLQYLTYGALGERDKQLHVLRVFSSYMCDIRYKDNMFHPETAWNLMGHCAEMEGDYDIAMRCYAGSLSVLNQNNAANWHVRRVMRLLNGQIQI